MNIEQVLQSIAICTYGNLRLKYESADLGPLKVMGPVSCCSEILFERSMPKGGTYLIAAAPEHFVKQLVKEDTSLFRILFSTPRVPNEAWSFYIQTEGNAGLEKWEGYWKFRGEQRDGRNWKVVYDSVRGNRFAEVGIKTCQSALEQLFISRAELAERLAHEGIQVWPARLMNLTGFTQSGQNSLDHCPELIPSKLYSQHARILMADALRSLHVLLSKDFSQLQEQFEADQLARALREFRLAVQSGIESAVAGKDAFVSEAEQAA